MHSETPAETAADPELVRRLHAVYGLDTSLAERIIEDVLLSCADTVEEWIRSRHIRLQGYGLRNDEIYRRIARELRDRRFAAESLSLRQIRRIIYG